MSDTRNRIWLNPLVDESVPLALLVILCLLFFHQVLGGDEYVFPWDFRDYMYPTQRFVGSALRSGELPLWDPYVFMGYPIIGDPQASVFNPLYLLFHLTPGLPPLSLRTLEWLEIIYVASAGVFAYWLARTAGLNRSGSFFAGLVYMLGGFFPVHVEHETWLVASSWIPLLFLLLMRMLAKHRVAYIVAISVVLALSLFSGYPQTTLFSAYFLVFLLAWESVSALRQHQFRTVLRNFVYLVLALFLGVAISAIQILPSAEFAVNAARGTANYAGTLTGGLEPGAWVTILFPKLLGSDGSFGYLGGEITHTQKYSGLAPLILFFVGLFALFRQNLARPGIHSMGFFGALGIVAFLGSFGPNLLVYRIFELLPFTTLFQRPATLFPFALLGIAMIGGMVCDRLAQTSLSKREPMPVRLIEHWQVKSLDELSIALGLAAVTAFFYALGVQRPEVLQKLFLVLQDSVLKARLIDPALLENLQQNSLKMLAFTSAICGLLAAMWILPKFRPLLVWGLVGLTFLDLYTFNAGQIFNTQKKGADVVFELSALLPASPLDSLGAYRIGLNFYPELMNSGNVLAVEEMNVYNPLKLRRVEEWLRTFPSINSRAFDVSNIQYIIVSDVNTERAGAPETFSQAVSGGMAYLPGEPPAPAKFILRTSTTDNWYHLWENQNFLPRFFGIDEYQVFEDSGRRLTALGSEGFDPSRVVILEEPFTETLSGRLAQPVSIRSYNKSSLEIAAKAIEGDILLLVSIPSYPGWNATVDGISSKIYIADHALMAIHLKPGEHVVRMTFEPISFKLGTGITGLCLVFCACVLIVGRLHGSSRTGDATTFRGPSHQES